MKSKITQLLMIKVTIIVATLFIAPNVQASIAGPNAEYIKGAGFVWEGDISAIINVNQSGTIKSGAFSVAGLFAITLDTMNSCISSSMFATSSDGKAKGIQLAHDVIFVLNAEAEGNVYRFNNGNIWQFISGGMKFNDLSASTSGYANITTDCPWDVGFIRSWSNGTDDIGVKPIYANISGIGRLYIGPEAKTGVVNFPEIYFMKGYVDSGYKYTTQVLINSSQFNIVSSLSCTISAPPTVNFGIVHGLGVKENLFLAQKTGDLIINCTGDERVGGADVKVQVLGNAPNYNYILPLKNDKGELAPGEIRGWLNKAPTNTCSGNANSTNGLFFGDSSKWYNSGELKAGSNTIPYVFNLCGSGKNKINNLGHASATATINLSWD